MGADLSIETVDPFIIRYIATLGWDIDIAAARSGCKRLRRAISVPIRRTPRELFIYGAEHDSVYLCKLAQERDTYIAENMAFFMGRYSGKKFQEAYYDVNHETDGWYIHTMLEAAARSGRIDWCLSHSPKLKEGFGIGHSFEWRSIVKGAAYGGHADIFYKMPGMVLPNGSIHCDMCAGLIMEGGAAGGREDMCALAKRWGCDDYNMMVTQATAEDHVDIFQKAMEWGASGFDHSGFGHTIGPASVCGIRTLLNGWFLPGYTVWFRTPIDINMCTLAKLYNVITIRDITRHYLCFYEKEDLMSKLIDQGWASQDEWRDVAEDVLYCGVRNMRLCHLAKVCGATKFSDMLIRAARYNEVELASLAIEWGATNLEEALLIASRDPYEQKVAKLLQDEIALRKEKSLPITPFICY